jgi:hypothetical protein
MAEQEKNLKNKVENEITKYETLKKAFYQIYEYEKETSKTRLNSYQQINTIKEGDNTELSKIYNEFYNTMKKLETDRSVHLDKIWKTILPITAYYPEKLEKYKKDLSNIKNLREQTEKSTKEQEKAKNKKDVNAVRNLNADIKQKEQKQKQESNNFERKLVQFESERVNDNKCLFLHYIHSELQYHAKALEKMSSLFNLINSIEPRSELPNFERKYGINIDLKEINIDINKINEEKRRLEELKNIQTNKVFGDNNNNNNNNNNN